VNHNNPETGKVELVRVLRTVPAGVRIMKSYPNIQNDPGVTDWKEDSEWEREKVFGDLLRWQYSELNDSNAAVARSRWDSLKCWHRSHPTADTVTVGEPATIGTDELRSPLLPWADMWTLLKTFVAPAPAPATALVPAPAPAAGKKRVDRQRLGASTSAAHVNVVTHPGYSEADQRVALLQGESGQQYISQNLTVRGALFLIRLEHAEGELAVGLGRRTFDATVDQEGVVYGIQWFERKNKKNDDWGVRPSFCLSVASRRPKIAYQTSTEKFSDFLPIAVKTNGTSDEPALTSDCLTALRAYLQSAQTADASETDEEPVGRGKKRRKNAVVTV